MWNAERGNSFEMKMETAESKYSHWFEGAEPLWITAVKQEKRTHMFEWPGGHIPNNGTTSTFYDEMGVDDWPMISHMMKNLKKAFNLFKTDKIDMAGVFVDVVDDGGHSYGPNSNELKDIIRQTDDAIKQMLDMIVQEGLENKVNIVIFSDHGMTEISESRTIDISDHIGSPDVEVVRDKGAVCSIWPREGKLEKVYSNLQQMNNKHITVYKKENLPERWHYKHNQLVAPIIVVAELGWYILTPSGQSIDKYRAGPAKGHHGYDNAEKDMRGIFLAFGPDFKKNFQNGPVKAVDIYQVMCKALKIQPLPHKGNWSSVKDIFI
ncbi:glycerophosphocholine cholinephosphodiesterase ENPP6-like [Mytilus californianus]|uniref:glycerophosphocholine cholinephosphodiesterase ENPP6-like n=1 Tax=Mytilus californianus TaxID=6549 RepID=UPI002245480E|nr:glycerophosphocholine cholinephosphodiesterase ENPP6-like [Mytilus californianus]